MIKVQKSNPFSIKYKIVRFFFYLPLLPFIKKIRGIQNLPGEGAFIIAANHSSHIDWLLLLCNLTGVLNRHFHFLATIKYRSNPLFKFLVELTRSVWVDLKEQARSLLITLKYLRDGEIMVIFPEGTRSPDGKIRKGKAGVAALALQAKTPVVPVGLVNTHKILPRGAFFPRFIRCKINIGEPLKFDSYYEDYDEAIAQNDQTKILEIEEKIVRIIMKEIAKLSGQKYPY